VSVKLTFHVVGVSHHTASMRVREQLALMEAEVINWLERQPAAGRSTAVLSTCNRFEVYWTGDYDLEPWFVELARARSVEPPTAVARWEGVDCVRHLYQVAAGLDCRYVGQGYELRVTLADGPFTEAALDEFHRLHEREYGSAYGDPIEIVNARVTAIGKRPTLHELPVESLRAKLDGARAEQAIVELEGREDALARCRGQGREEKPVSLLCSRNAHDRNVLVRRAHEIQFAPTLWNPLLVRPSEVEIKECI